MSAELALLGKIKALVNSVKGTTESNSTALSENRGILNILNAPSIDSASLRIFEGITTTINLTVSKVSDYIDVNFYYPGGSKITVSNNPLLANNSVNVTLPPEIVALSAGIEIQITINNAGNTSESSAISRSIVALPTGGDTIQVIDGYRIHTFTTSSNFVATSTLPVDYLIVAGGAGGGGGAMAGGGGAGGLLYASLTIPQAAYTITVGAGGAGGYAYNLSNQSGVNGSNSFALDLTAIGGGGGCGWSGHPAAAGGSGGGGNEVNTGGVGTPGQGNPGGTTPGSYTSRTGSGGGGSSTAGGNGSSTNGGAGGDGFLTSISGTAAYYAGGGGGGTEGSASPGAGGSGGGGAGSLGTVKATDATINTGSGGGGAGYSGSGTGRIGGNGGSGIVIIRYAV